MTHEERDAAQHAALRAAFLAGYDAGWNESGEGHNGEYASQSFNQSGYEASRAAALAQYQETTP